MIPRLLALLLIFPTIIVGNQSSPDTDGNNTTTIANGYMEIYIANIRAVREERDRCLADAATDAEREHVRQQYTEVVIERLEAVHARLNSECKLVIGDDRQLEEAQEFIITYVFNRAVATALSRLICKNGAPHVPFGQMVSQNDCALCKKLNNACMRTVTYKEVDLAAVQPITIADIKAAYQ